MKKIRIAVCVLLALTFVSCNKLSKSELAEILEPMVPLLQEIGNVYFIADFPDGGREEKIADKDGKEYYVIRSDSLPDIDAMKELAERALTPEFAQTRLYQCAFDQDRPIYKMIDGQLCNVQGDWIDYLSLGDLDTLEIVSQSDTQIVAKTQVSDGLPGVSSMTITLENTAVGWRIDDLVEG